MRTTRGLVGIAAALAVGGVGLGPVGLGAAGAQIAPTLVVSPLRVDPEEAVTFTVRDCAVAPELQVGESDFIRLVEPAATGTAGEWSAQVAAGLTDWTVTGTCGDVDLGEVGVDIDYPLMSFLPIGAYAPQPDPPSEVFGSDCPDDTEATVTFEDEAHGFRDTQTAAIDERGDWRVTPGYPAVGIYPPVPLHITVRASCGAVTYAPLTYDFLLGEPVPTTTSSTTSTPTSPRSVAEPPPAVPRSGRSSYTG